MGRRILVPASLQLSPYFLLRTSQTYAYSLSVPSKKKKTGKYYGATIALFYRSFPPFRAQRNAPAGHKTDSGGGGGVPISASLLSHSLNTTWPEF